MKVNLICVGAGKCGTTWLYGLLLAHPECCASNVKETQYFENYYERGERWYQSCFNPSPDQRILAEVSNTYLFSPRVADRIRAYNPAVKLVVTVRNPIDRALSHYLFLRRNGERLPEFGEALLANHHQHIFWRGLYFRHLQPYIERFSKAQIKVLVHEDLVADAAAYGESLLRFAGVTPVVPEFDVSQYRLAASAPRSALAARALKKGAQLARDLRMESLVQRVKESIVPGLAYRETTEDEKPRIDAALRARLIEYFMADAAELSDWLGRDLAREWFDGAHHA